MTIELKSFFIQYHTYICTSEKWKLVFENVLILFYLIASFNMKVISWRIWVVLKSYALVGGRLSGWVKEGCLCSGHPSFFHFALGYMPSSPEEDCSLAVSQRSRFSEVRDGVLNEECRGFYASLGINQFFRKTINGSAIF